MKQIQEKISNAGIPLGADTTTLGLIYKAAEEAVGEKMYSQALDCYKMLYDLTNDMEIADRISKLEKEDSR